MNEITYLFPSYILWEKTKEADGIRILRVYSKDCEVAIPDQIAGLAVKEIGPYCFSATAPKYQSGQQIFITELYYIEETAVAMRQFPTISQEMPSENTKAYQDSDCCQSPLSKNQPFPDTIRELPAMAGKILKAVYLPEGVTTLHNAAFYNCRFLHTLSLPPDISGIGSDEFTNCLRLNHILLRCEDHRRSGLSLILERITTDLNIYFAPDGLHPHAALFFPEYYEWLDEVSPAHLFTRSINGEGFRLRKAFQDHVIDYKKYDACWENALKIENESCLCHLSYLRLRYEGRIDEDAKKAYLHYLKEHILAAMAPFIKEKELDALCFLCELVDPDASQLLQAIDYATQMEWSQGVAYLMERNKPANSFAEKAFDFDFDDF